MRIQFIILCSLFLCLLAACKRGYEVVNDKVYYNYWNEGNGQGKRWLEIADAKTFQTLEMNCDADFDFAKDKQYLYMDGQAVKGIDPNSFKFVGHYVFSDKHAAYFFGAYNNLNECEIKGVDPTKIQLLTYPWAKAGNVLIHGYDTLTVVDINDLQILNKDWAKTKTQVIYEQTFVSGADAASFKMLNDYTGKDKHHTYEFGKLKN